MTLFGRQVKKSREASAPAWLIAYLFEGALPERGGPDWRAYVDARFLGAATRRPECTLTSLIERHRPELEAEAKRRRVCLDLKRWAPALDCEVGCRIRARQRGL
jgi:hypothetical protein